MLAGLKLESKKKDLLDVRRFCEGVPPRPVGLSCKGGTVQGREVLSLRD